MKRIIGVTGGVGAGKSEVLEILRQEYGANVILTDQVAKDLMEPGREGYRQVAAYLGGEILNPDGSINRPKMASVIFTQEEKRLGVNRLIHPLVWEEVMRELKESRESLQVVETALPEKCEATCGVYYGNGAQSREIVLGFRPKAVLILQAGYQMVTSGGVCFGGLALDGRTMQYKNNTAIAVTDQGFQVAYLTGDSNILTNYSGNLYFYVALT